ncbi:MAG: DUF4445 domain-containing protein [Bacteroidales bacterium]|nr:DUF4445 domain-containing protein [Bacteroidales bacterium]
MIELKIFENGKSHVIETKPGETLLTILQKHGYSVYAPCGGRGTCGKCLINIKDKGHVLSCTYYPEKNIEVILPGKVESTILTGQTDCLEDLQLDINNAGYLTGNPYGAAVDIGTTTVVLYFLDMLTGKIEKISSFLNPQNIYGADVITRIGYCQEYENSLKELQMAVVNEINRSLDDFTKEVKCTPENLEKLVFVGNTNMLHILLGEYPVSMALAPFTQKFIDTQTKTGNQSELNVNANAGIVTLPCISAYVGADIVAGLAALKVSHKNYLFIDIGTNGEIALVKGKEIYTCATAAGPTFEGANISCGMAAVSGAIASFTGNNHYRMIGNAGPVGICGSGIIDIMAYLVKNRLVDESGLLHETFIIHKKNNIRVTQDDIREIQLAKSTVYSGIKTLLNVVGLSFTSVEALFIAGGFGNYINIHSALLIGLLSYEIKDKIYPVGNSTGIGALQYLKSDFFKKKSDTIIKQYHYTELSDLDEFTTEFALNMNFNQYV